MNSDCDRPIDLLVSDLEHQSSCDRCSDAALVDSFLADASPVRAKVVMPSSVIWVQGQIERRKQYAAELERRDRRTRLWITVSLVAAWAIFCAIAWKPLLDWIAGLETSGFSLVATGPVPPSILGWTLVTLVLITMAMATRGLALE